jgi:hypothetical protein
VDEFKQKGNYLKGAMMQPSTISVSFLLSMISFISIACHHPPLNSSETGRGYGQVTDPKCWFINSYENGVITVQHEGKTYKAKCDISRSFNNAKSITDPNNVVTFENCSLAIDLVGTNVQPFEGKEKDTKGNVVVMWNVGSMLALRSWRDEHSPWRIDEFIIISVTKNP